MVNWHEQIQLINRKKKLHKAGSSAVLNIALERGEKKEKERGSYNKGYSYLVNQLSRNPAKQGFTLLSGWDVVLSFWNSDPKLDTFF